MVQLTKAALKLFFETGDIPTESQFGDFIDSYSNLQDENQLIGQELTINDISPSLQSTAFQITKKVNVITVTHEVKGAVKLPLAEPNKICVVSNFGDDLSDIFPLSGDKFLLESINDPVTILQEQSLLFICVDDNIWSFVDLAPIVIPEPVFASVQSEPSDPTGTSSSTGVMMGIAVSFSPTATGKILVILSGDMGTTSGSGSAGPEIKQIRYGTGDAPANGDALTGTAVGGEPASSIDHSGGTPFSVQAVVIGLSTDSTFWFDFGLAEIGLGTGSARNVSMTIVELP